MTTNYADIALLERVKRSDRDAFGELFRSYQPFLFRFIFFSLRDPDTVHEIVQETFVRVWEHRSSLKPELPFAGLLLRISTNLMRDLARQRSVRERLNREIPPPARSIDDDPAEAVQARMLEEHITAILGRLGARCRTVFLLSRYEGKSHSEIASMLGIRQKTVENQITRALRALKKGLGKEYER